MTPALCKHESRPVSFPLVVDDFEVKYLDKQYVQHLIDALRAMYMITVDWRGKHFLGLMLEWDYEAGHVTISMPGYIRQALHKFKHPINRPQTHSPSKVIAPTYGTKVQYAEQEDNNIILPASDIKHVQSVIGTLLYYA